MTVYSLFIICRSADIMFALQFFGA